METMTQNYVEYIYKQKLTDKTNEMLAKIKDYVKNQHESVKDENLKLQVKPEFFNLTVENNMVQNLSKTKAKKLNKIIFNLENRWSLNSMNRLLHFITKQLLKTTTMKIEKCKKEVNIQIKRKAWVKARNEAEILLKAYKDEKGDYYKNK